jgi:hypothetical protein
VVGRAPVWADPTASAPGEDASGDAASLPLPGLTTPAAQALAAVDVLESALLAEVAQGAADTAGAQAMAAGAQDAEGADGANSTASAQGATASQSQGAQAQAAQGAALAGQSAPVAALAASLAQTVAQSGLFYESHLAQWLRGQLTPGDLADEPQNRLTGGGTQLPLDWSQGADDVDDVLWTDLPGAAQQGARATAASSAAETAGTAGMPTRGEGNAATLAQEAAHANATLADTLLPAVRLANSANAGAGVGVHEAVLPLVRQQLDLLATGEFRWTGEAWPGVRLDWTIAQDDYEARDGRGGRGGRDPRTGRSADDDETPWHTRLTLALPSLGTVDAELTLAGSTLAVRVQASPGGAQRLTAHSEALRGRIAALGLALAGLSIREIGGAAGGAMGVDGTRAAEAWARAAAAQTHEAAHTDATGAASRAANVSHAADASVNAGQTDWELG